MATGQTPSLAAAKKVFHIDVRIIFKVKVGIQITDESSIQIENHSLLVEWFVNRIIYYLLPDMSLRHIGDLV